MFKYNIEELTIENEDKYLDKVADLEKIVLSSMEESGKIGQLFITGKEDISEYVHSKSNTVMIAIDNKDEVQAATYITQGQIPFTYNDITKYFKCGEKYNEYVRSLYSTQNKYKKDMLDIYGIKIEAFKYAKEKILKEKSNYNNIIDYLEYELKNNEFHEKSELREELNKYMSEYIQKQKLEQEYERFYWITAKDISKEFRIDVNTDKVKHIDVKEYEKLMELEEKEYETILEKGNFVIHEEPNFDETKYYSSNTTNTVEIDTYITSPNQRHAGIARILVYEGIKKHIEERFRDPKNKEIYLCSTLHRKNLSSKYVSEFFGLTDSLYVKRRQGRDREVHICKIEREKVKQYLEDLQDKLIIFYGYNPTNKKISDERKIDLLKNQLKYEKNQFIRLNGIRHSENNYHGLLDDIQSKANKINRFKDQIINLERERDGIGEI